MDLCQRNLRNSNRIPQNSWSCQSCQIHQRKHQLTSESPAPGVKSTEDFQEKVLWHLAQSDVWLTVYKWVTPIMLTIQSSQLVCAFGVHAEVVDRVIRCPITVTGSVNISFVWWGENVSKPRPRVVWFTTVVTDVQWVTKSVSLRSKKPRRIRVWEPLTVRAIGVSFVWWGWSFETAASTPANGMSWLSHRRSGRSVYW